MNTKLIRKALAIAALSVVGILGLAGRCGATTVVPTNTAPTATMPGFYGEQAVTPTVTWLQASISVPATVTQITSSWVMAASSSGSTWSQVGWTNNGTGAQVFTQVWDGSSLNTHFYGSASGAITTAVACWPGTDAFFNFLYVGGSIGWGGPVGGTWEVLNSYSIPGQQCGNALQWSAMEESHAAVPVLFIDLLTNDSGVGVYWPNMLVG